MDGGSPRTYFATVGGKYYFISALAEVDGVTIEHNITPFADVGVLHDVSLIYTATAMINTIGCRYTRGEQFFKGFLFDLKITGITNLDTYPSGTAHFKLDESYSNLHQFVDYDNGVIGTKYNDVAADYTQVLP